MNSFGEEIRKLRLDKNLPLRTVAAFLDIDQAILSKIERDLRPASREVVLKLAGYYQAPIKHLMTLWLAERIVYEIGDEEMALDAIKLAEEKVAYKTLKGPKLEVVRPQLIEVLKADPRILKAWVFGSVSRDEADWKSDIDVMISIDASEPFSLFDLAEIQYQGEMKTGFKIDLVMEGAVKSFAEGNVNQDKLLIYEK